MQYNQSGYYTPPQSYPQPPQYAQPQQYAQPVQTQQYPQNGYPSPAYNPPLQNAYAAYPNQSITPGLSFQDQQGLKGWNDPPSKNIETKSLQGIDNPIGLVVSTFTIALDAIKPLSNNPSVKRMVEDTEKRIEGLLDRLSSNSVPDSVLVSLVHLSQALKVKDFGTANGVVMKLMTSNLSDETKWIVGAKRLIELYARV